MVTDLEPDLLALSRIIAFTVYDKLGCSGLLVVLAACCIILAIDKTVIISGTVIKYIKLRGDSCSGIVIIITVKHYFNTV